MFALEKPPVCAQRAGMDTPQNEVLGFIYPNGINALLSWTSPCKKDDASRGFGHRTKYFRSEVFPPLVRVRVWAVCSYCKTRIQKQDSSICPRCQQPLVSKTTSRATLSLVP